METPGVTPRAAAPDHRATQARPGDRGRHGPGGHRSRLEQKAPAAPGKWAHCALCLWTTAPIQPQARRTEAAHPTTSSRKREGDRRDQGQTHHRRSHRNREGRPRSWPVQRELVVAVLRVCCGTVATPTRMSHHTASSRKREGPCDGRGPQSNRKRGGQEPRTTTQGTQARTSPARDEEWRWFRPPKVPPG